MNPYITNEDEKYRKIFLHAGDTYYINRKIADNKNMFEWIKFSLNVTKTIHRDFPNEKEQYIGITDKQKAKSRVETLK